MQYKVLIIDDEPLARSMLLEYLQAYPQLQVMEECNNGFEGVKAIQQHNPDLIFLDIQMPGFDGFSVVQGVMDIDPPLFVFVTAYSEHAIKAFEAQAIDYLMKPVEPERLADTMDRVRSRLSDKRTSEELDRLRTVINEVAPDAADNLVSLDDDLVSTRFEKLINVKDRGQIFRVDVASIERIDAAGDYMCIHTADNSLILRETMKDLEKRLDPRTFQRVHRSTIVNLDQVRQVKPHTNGECFLVLESGAQVKVSRSYRDVVARFVH